MAGNEHQARIDACRANAESNNAADRPASASIPAGQCHGLWNTNAGGLLHAMVSLYDEQLLPL
ncbi:hypothetical protein [Bifidobacterium phasiani]|uniref:Uncharacterized protein n=1 Tax=Bifidobacterium phasiani TaxID=2834431 RepID=A0ABS6W6H7_9BIFI|nr:hypothetical protein [Bifidobacterium phasiani]MBW3082093.1 hypothetical protein [Bifidobacterium phasiani]